MLLLAELLLFTWWRGLFGLYASPVVLYGLAVAICVALYHYIRHAGWPVGTITSSTQPWSSRLAMLAASIAGVWVGSAWVRKIMREMPINIDSSDIIPALHVYARRWLMNQEIYTPLTQELGKFALPTYLPATWFPFVLSEWLGFDYRLLAWVALLLLGAGSYLLVMWPRQRHWLATLVLALVPFFSIFFLLRTERSLVGQTVEGVIIGYYAVLVAGILRRSGPLEALGLLLCLLSRYALIFWVPLYLGLMFFQDSRRRALVLAGTVLLGVVALYVVPYLSHDWTMPGQVLRAYTTVAVGEWQHLNADGLPYHLYNGVGMAPFFFQYGSGTLLDRIVLLKTVHMGLLVLLVVGAAVLYWRQRGVRTNYRLYAVLVLKLYLATFYAFLQVPYAYLAAVGVFLSVFLVLITENVAPNDALDEHFTSSSTEQPLAE